MVSVWVFITFLEKKRPNKYVYENYEKKISFPACVTFVFGYFCGVY